jgi:hypothetical protein
MCGATFPKNNFTSGVFGNPCHNHFQRPIKIHSYHNDSSGPKRKVVDFHPKNTEESWRRLESVCSNPTQLRILEGDTVMDLSTVYSHIMPQTHSQNHMQVITPEAEEIIS